jgi:hypothetical protein
MGWFGRFEEEREKQEEDAMSPLTGMRVGKLLRGSWFERVSDRTGLTALWVVTDWPVEEGWVLCVHLLSGMADRLRGEELVFLRPRPRLT